MKIEIKTWEHLTNGLITLTIIGGGITYLIQTEYAKRYRFWFKNYFLPTSTKIVKKGIEVIEKMPEKDQKILLNFAVNYADIGVKEFKKRMKLQTDILDKNDLNALGKLGAKKVKEYFDTK